MKVGLFPLSDGAFDAARWLCHGALDGTLLALATWLATATLLRRASGRLLSWLWLSVLLKFVLVWSLPWHALPLAPETRAVAAALADGADHAWVVRVYGALIVALLARLLWRQRALRRRVAALPLAEPQIVACVRAAARALRLDHLPEVRVSAAPMAPYIVGPLQPTLVLPIWLCTPGARLEAVLLHELAHLQRYDHWSLWLQRLVSTLFFFWPPVHWVARKLDEARELACDERAVQCSGLPAAAYATHLVDVVAQVRGPVPEGCALAMGRAAVRLEQRIDRLLAEAWATRMSVLEASCVLLLALGAVGSVRLARGQSGQPQAASESLLPSTSGVQAVDPSALTVELSECERAARAQRQDCSFQSCE